MAMAFFIQPVSNNFKLRFYGFALSLLFFFFALCITATPAHPHSLFVSYSLSLPFPLLLFHSSLILCILTLPSLVLYSSPFQCFFFLPFSSHIFSFSFMASCSGLGNEGSGIKYGRCLGAGSQTVYQRTKKLKLDEDRHRSED